MVVDPVPHLFTVDEYEAMGRAGVFPGGKRLELLGGEIVEMTPIGSPHAPIVNRLNRLLVVGLGERAVVAVQNAVVLSDVSEPQPDLALLRPRADFYAAAHPRPDDVLLVIEVADSTRSWDRRVKRPLYARAGVAEVWIVDITARVVEVAIGPTGDGYGHVQQLGGRDGLPGGVPRRVDRRRRAVRPSRARRSRPLPAALRVRRGSSLSTTGMSAVELRR